VSQPVPDTAPPWRRKIRTNETLLFRYSALIFNAHRIQYDRDYAKNEVTAGWWSTGHCALAMTARAELAA